MNHYELDVAGKLCDLCLYMVKSVNKYIVPDCAFCNTELEGLLCESSLEDIEPGDEHVW